MEKAWPYRYAARLEVDQLVGGTPSDPKVAENWLRSKLADPDDLIREKVAEIMLEREVSAEEAASIVDSLRHLNGFKRSDGVLFIEGRQAKACLKEAAMVAANAGKLRAEKWGKPTAAYYKKGIKGWFPEHVFVAEDQIPLGRLNGSEALDPVMECSRINQRFSHTKRGAAIQYEEIAEQVAIDLTVVTDHLFKDEEWAMIWLTAEQLGIGATRSQGYGRFVLTRWERLD
jgi:hypothetical protein